MKYTDFAVDGKFFGEKLQPLNKENFEAYEAEFGKEKAEGYLQAISDIQNTMTEILDPVDNRKGGLPNSPIIVRNYIIRIFNHNKIFLNSVSVITNQDKFHPSL